MLSSSNPEDISFFQRPTLEGKQLHKMLICAPGTSLWAIRPSVKVKLNQVCNFNCYGNRGLDVNSCVYVEVGPGSSVDIATCYGLDGPGIESRWG